MIKSGATAAAAASGGRNESSSSSIRSGRGGVKGKIGEGVKERGNMDETESGSQLSSERRMGTMTQMSSSEKLMRSGSSDSGNIVTKLGRPPKTPAHHTNTEMESVSIQEGDGMDSYGEGSKYRKGSKRSRIGNEDLLSDTEGNENVKKYGIDELLVQLDNQIQEVYKKGERGRTNYNKLVTLDLFRKINLEIISRDAEMNNLKDRLLDVQDEKIALQKQIIELQSGRGSGMNEEVERSYMDVVLKGRSKEISEGKQLPMTAIPEIIRHAPAERILIYKSEMKGEMVTRAKQEEFRCDLKVTLGDEIMEEVSAVRPTRYGGHTIIFSSEEGREKALSVIKNNEAERGIDERNTCIIAPKRKKSKVVCREVPSDISPEEMLKEMYEKHNPLLLNILKERREARIFVTRLGWIFELSVVEAIAIHSQNGRIRYGMGRELKTEEFIPLQQCYKCCNFGHNAQECRVEGEWCRLCGRKGYSGKVCPVKEQKEKWRCANCLWKNEMKGMKLDVNHGAAQLHKCAVALQQKEIRKSQLASAGVFTSSIDVKKKNLDTYGRSGELGQSGVEKSGSRGGANIRRKTRSKSIRRQEGVNSGNIQGSTMVPSSSSLSSRQLFSNVNSGNQMGRMIRPVPTHNWQTVGRHSEGNEREGRGRGRDYYSGGINSSQSELNYATDIVMEKPSQNIAYYHYHE